MRPEWFDYLSDGGLIRRYEAIQHRPLDPICGAYRDEIQARAVANGSVLDAQSGASYTFDPDAARIVRGEIDPAVLPARVAELRRLADIRNGYERILRRKEAASGARSRRRKHLDRPSRPRLPVPVPAQAIDRTR